LQKSCIRHWSYVSWTSRTVVASLALQSPGTCWCPGLGRLLASAALLRMAPGPGTDYQRPSDNQNCRSFHLSASSRPICSRQCWLQLCVSCTVVPSALLLQRVRRRLQVFRLESTRQCHDLFRMTGFKHCCETVSLSSPHVYSNWAVHSFTLKFANRKSSVHSSQCAMNKALSHC